MTDLLRDVIAQNRAGKGTAIPSVCSAHEDVLEASLQRAHMLSRPIVIEATSNQVNQFGGYTGLTPAQFCDRVEALRDSVGLVPDHMVLGGDHLGPQAWRKEPAADAMAKAREMMQAYVAAGFTKIHLDCSEGCADDPAHPGDAVSASRAADLARECLEHAPNPEALLFVIGTEVPPPGGARAEESGGPSVTTAADACATLKAHQEAFEEAGLGTAWHQVGGLVVQPGVEFGPMEVYPLPDVDEAHFASVLESWPGGCLEAHSTDYQLPEVFPQLARMGFAFQKVGPALTFAWRRALYALEDLCHHADIPRQGQSVSAVMEEIMCANTGAWEGHYRGSEQELRLMRHFGLADRIRYYWNDPKAVKAVSELMADFDGRELPDPVLGQVFDADLIARIRLLQEAGYMLCRAVLVASVQTDLDPYFW